MSEYSCTKRVTVELPVDRVYTKNGKAVFVIGHTDGLRIDEDKCILVSGKIVKVAHQQ
jgi:hypothetical protein